MKRLARNTVKAVATLSVPDRLPPAITRPRHHVEAVLAQSLLETGDDGRAALAWTWALTGTRPSPITLSVAPGQPPSREQILAEADADPEGSTAPSGVPTDYCDQIGEARRILLWLTGASDEIPLDDEHRGRFSSAPATTTPAPTTRSARSATTLSAPWPPSICLTRWTPQTLPVRGDGTLPG